MQYAQMTLGVQMDQVQSSFTELKQVGLISQERALKRRCGALRPWLNFRAGSFFSPTAICYSSRYSTLKENEARFALLHEEGHFSIRQHSRLLHAASRSAIWVSLITALVYVISAILVFAEVLVDLWFLPIVVNTGVGTVILLAIVSIAARVLGQAGLELDEDSSDDFAAERLARTFAVKRPSCVLDNLLRELERRRPYWMRRTESVLRFSLGDVHRPRQERVERITKKYDDFTP